MAAKTKVLIFYDNFGPYHRYRASKLATVFELRALELFGQSFEYQWDNYPRDTSVVHTISHPEDSVKKSKLALKREILNFLPEVVIFPGWSSCFSAYCLDICKTLDIRTVLSSDSQASDHARNRIREMIKAKIVQQFDAAFVSGQRAKSYLTQLGFPSEYCVEGMNVVDNTHFERETNAVTKADGNTPEVEQPYFLCVSRLVEKKNISSLIEAYMNACSINTSLPRLIIAGDGPQRSKLEELAQSLGGGGRIVFNGLTSYDELPSYYAKATALILPSRVEPWGLVVNEAMSTSTPAIVSENCGVAHDLVLNDLTGFVYDPLDADALTSTLLRFAALNDQTLRELGKQAKIKAETLNGESYVKNAREVVRLAMNRPKGRNHFTDRAVRLSLSKIRGRE